MSLLTIAYAQWPEGLVPKGTVWDSISANPHRYSMAEKGHGFGGGGFMYSPDGQLLEPQGSTSLDALIQMVDIDLQRARAQKSEYPCYVSELSD